MNFLHLEPDPSLFSNAGAECRLREIQLATSICEQIASPKPADRNDAAGEGLGELCVDKIIVSYS